MTNSITIARSILERALRGIIENPGGLALFRAGLNLHPEGVGLIAQDIVVVREATLASHPIARHHCFTLSFPASGIPPFSPAEGKGDRWIRGAIVLGQEGARGSASGFIIFRNSFLPLDYLKVPGPGMEQLQLLSPKATTISKKPMFGAEVPPVTKDLERWSRTIGALGGEDIWQRLIHLHPCVVGVGRSGSLVASTLARFGIKRITLIDPDLMERHNLDAMDGVTERDIGRSKAEAVAGYISQLRPGLEVGGLVGSITQREGIARAKVCDLLFSCVDDDAGRLAVTTIATLYCQPLIDIGTGVFYHQEERFMGADVRLILPGEGCLLCWGGLAGGKEQALDRLGQGREIRQTPWFQERAGSLGSLNGMAVNMAVQMLLDLVAGRVGGSLWARLIVDHEGLIRVNYLEREDNQECTLCRRLGLGDEVIFWGGRTSPHVLG